MIREENLHVTRLQQAMTTLMSGDLLRRPGALILA
jgi:hypothetical protein